MPVVKLKNYYPFSHGVLKRHLVLPMPVDLILTCEQMAYADVRLAGAIWMLCATFWQSGAKPLPEAESELACICRCNTGTWYRVRAPVMEAVEKLIPKLRDMYVKSKDVAEWRHRTGVKAGLASAMAARERKARQMAGQSGGALPNMREQSKEGPSAVPPLAHTMVRGRQSADSVPKSRLEGVGLMGDKRKG